MKPLTLIPGRSYLLRDAIYSSNPLPVTFERCLGGSRLFWPDGSVSHSGNWYEFRFRPEFCFKFRVLHESQLAQITAPKLLTFPI